VSEPSRVQIARAVPGGSRRARDQRTWLRSVTAAIEGQGWYACRAHHPAEVARVLARYMDWKRRTSRPGHEHIATAAGISLRTVRRAVAWLAAEGFLGCVSPGTTPLLRPGVLHGLSDLAELNCAAVYVLAVPRPRQASSSAETEFGLLSPSGRRVVKVPPARQVRAGKVKNENARTPCGRPSVPPPAEPFPAQKTPKSRSEGLAAAEVIRDRSRLLSALSARHLRHIAKPYFAAGWTAADVLHAVEHGPGGRGHGYTADVRYVSGWLRSRLALWQNAENGPLPSRSQRLQAERDRIRADQSARRSDALRASEGSAAVDVAGRAAELRAIVRAARLSPL
jgi:hypothetical protein